jgi:DNA-binding NtrC family response regulator
LIVVKILVVDDEGIVLNSCRKILEPEGFEVLLAQSVDDALNIIDTQERPMRCMLLVDVKMPVHDGMYFLKRIKEKHMDLPIIVMSGYPTEETIQTAESHGAATFIAKPFTPEELLDTVLSVVQKGKTT